ncbi:MAG: aspartate/glutamate racemase family protein [Burkholderiaceae bacterium]
MLDTRFPRPLGDIGHPDTWPVPVVRHVVRGVWPDKVVQSAAGLRAGRVVPAFVDIMRKLERQGAKALTTSCGFLALLQKDLQASVKIPVVTSSLMLLPQVLREEPHAGVLTISASKLGTEFLRSAGVPKERLKDVIVQGVDPRGEFAAAILGNRAEMDVPKAGQEVIDAAVALKARAPHLKTLVLECTNMPPYAPFIEQATGLRVLSLKDSPVLRRALGVESLAPAPARSAGPAAGGAA